MYQKHFKFKRKPFEQLPDPEFLFLTGQHEEALTRMNFALATNDSFAVITGEVGSGKTTLVRRMLADVSKNAAIAFITHTRVTDVELLQLILVEFGLRPFDMGKVELLVELRNFIEERHREHKRVIIVVDEAQNLGIDVLEELRLLTCLDSTEEKAVNIVLSGQPQLSRLIDSPELEQLRQRCRLRFHLHRLSKEQTVRYIEHRLAIAKGEESRLFEPGAISAVFELTAGVPRLINTLCDTALIMAWLADADVVTAASVSEAADELGWPNDRAVHHIGGIGDIRTLPTLLVRKDAKLVSEFVLAESSYIIGRAEDCSIVVESKYLSRHHAILSRHDSVWMISDLKSTNGIRVNGRSVKSQELQDGDIIAIGAHHMVFRTPVEDESVAQDDVDNDPASEFAETLVITDETA
jgi:type II secretory pathway predicted ATPase ExeA